MSCKTCGSNSNTLTNGDCFENALDVLKSHYTYFRNALQLRDLELQQVKERNEKLNKALELLQKEQQPPKRFKSQQNRNEAWIAHNSSQENRVSSDISLTDDEPMGATNLNVALNSEQLFDTSSLSQTKADNNMPSFSEIVQTPLLKESPKRNKQRDAMRCLKNRNSKNLERSKSEWRTKERNSPVENSWATKFLQPAKTKTSEEKLSGEGKRTADKKLCLSLKKTNPAKTKQSLLSFNKAKDTSVQEIKNADDIIEASPMVASSSTKASRSWAHRSGKNSNIKSNSITNQITTIPKDDIDKILDDIVFDFSPSKKTDSTLSLNSPDRVASKQLKFDSDAPKDCLENLAISENKSDSSSVVILTPGSQEIIFVDDTEILDLMTDVIKSDGLEKLKKYESKSLQIPQKSKETTDHFKKPEKVLEKDVNCDSLPKVKQENITEQNIENKEKKKEVHEEKPSCSKSTSHIKTTKPQNPLFLSDNLDTEDDEDFMPKPFIIKEEAETSSKALEKKPSFQQRFNINCEDCEKLIKFLDKSGMTDAQIQEHLDRCKRHNKSEFIRQKTPPDFWNPFILSFQADDPRNEVLVDDRFKNSKN